MRVMEVASPYAKVAKTRQKSDVNFGQQYARYKSTLEKVFCNNLIKDFKIIKTEFNKNYLNNLIMDVWRLPKSQVSQTFNDLSKFFDRTGNDLRRLSQFADSIGLRTNEARTLVVDKNGDTLVGLYNLGPYDKGYFSKTDHEQVVLEFRNPDTGHFVGLSRDSENGLAITKNHERVELDYDDGFYYYKSLSKQGYKPSVYVDYRGNGDGSSGGSFWDIFR